VGRHAFAAALIALSLGLAVSARANGRIAAGNQIVVSPADPSLLVMETTFGLLISHDMGNSFGWVCESAIGYGAGGVQDPSIGVTAKVILAGLHEGLARSPDQGCSWSLALSDPVIDLVVRPDDPHTAFVLTSKYAGVGDAGENRFETRVLLTHDDGASWVLQGVSIDPAVQVETIDVAPSDPNRIYIGGALRRTTAEAGIETLGVVLASTDGGASYVESLIPLTFPYETNQGVAFLSAVDPKSPDRLYVRIRDVSVDRLLVSDDGAATFRTVYQGAGNLLGFALSSDGSKVFVGGPADGVAFASADRTDSGGALQFVRQSKVRVSCLSWAGGVLYACMGEPAHPFNPQLGVSADDGVIFATKFPFGCVRGALECPADTVGGQCSPGLAQLRASLGSCDAGWTDSDAGLAPPDASTGGGSVASPLSPKARGCRCGVGGSQGAGGLSALVILVTMWLSRQSRRTRCACGHA
jgi:hypothetical protein